MNFLFIYPSPGVLGGVETLVARMSRWLTRNGHNVSVIVKWGRNWRELLPPEVRCFEIGERIAHLDYYWHAGKLWRSLEMPKPDVIKSFDIGSSLMACQLAVATGCLKVIAGIYNPLVFKHYYSIQNRMFWDSKTLCVQNLLKSIPPTARLFCGSDQLEELEQVHQQTGVLWPLPIDPGEFDHVPRKPRWGKIVSVGRLSPMKEYNLYMIDVVNQLVRKGYKVTWSVYGAGEYEPLMRERIDKDRLASVISIKGTVPYQRFGTVLQDAFLFVGMGTASLEAALLKVPNVVAFPYDSEGVTCGSICRLPAGSIGAPISCPPTLKVMDEIERILRLSPAEYQAEQELVYRHVQTHEVDVSMRRFLELVERAEPVAPNIARYLANYGFWFIRRAARLWGGEEVVQHPGCSSNSTARASTRV